MFGNIFKRRKKIGLVLSSGGLKGLAHIGVIETLIKNDIPIDYITGTSIGALLGGHYALYKNLDKTNELITGKHREQFACFFDLGLKGGLVKGDKVKKMLDTWFNGKKFEDTMIPFKAVATDITTGQPHIFSKGPLVEGVQASTAIPSLFKPIELKDEILVDGGICYPLPTSIIKKMGADIVIAVNLDNINKNPWFQKSDTKSIAKVSARSLDIMRHYLAQQAYKDADFVIEPENTESEAAIWKKYFWDGQGEETIEAGRIAAQKMIKKIKRKIRC